MTSHVDWDRWHDPYDDPTSGLARRLVVIQSALTDWLDDTAPQPVRLLSVCAGDGRDIIGVLTGRDDAVRVEAILLELDPRNVRRARRWVAAAGLDSVRVRECDAGLLSEWASAAPADLVLLAGVLGNISDADVRATIAALPGVCAPGAIVIWTRHRNAPDLTGPIRTWLQTAGFEERSFTAPNDAIFSVGVHHYRGAADAPNDTPNGQPTRVFTFIR